MESAAEQYASTIITKGRRTKRLRSASSITGGGVGGGGGGFGSNYSSSTASASGNCNSEDQDIMSEITTEEEDMANCLILLAQGTTTTVAAAAIQKIPVASRYECKTCNKTFPSFQALGGHRASHKKPKLATSPVPSPSPSPSPDHTNETHTNNNNHSNSNNKVVVNKVHECSICGSEFPSGQALGGHMRRHRAPPPISTAGRPIKSGGGPQPQPIRNVLSLDLNLPATGDDEDDGYKVEERLGQNNIAAATTTFHRVTPALVDCHY